MQREQQQHQQQQAKQLYQQQLQMEEEQKKHEKIIRESIEDPPIPDSLNVSDELADESLEKLEISIKKKETKALSGNDIEEQTQNIEMTEKKPFDQLTPTSAPTEVEIIVESELDPNLEKPAPVPVVEGQSAVKSGKVKGKKDKKKKQKSLDTNQPPAPLSFEEQMQKMEENDKVIQQVEKLAKESSALWTPNTMTFPPEKPLVSSFGFDFNNSPGSGPGGQSTGFSGPIKVPPSEIKNASLEARVGILEAEVSVLKVEVEQLKEDLMRALQTIDQDRASANRLATEARVSAAKAVTQLAPMAPAITPAAPAQGNQPLLTVQAQPSVTDDEVARYKAAREAIKAQRRSRT